MSESSFELKYNSAPPHLHTDALPPEARKWADRFTIYGGGDVTTPIGTAVKCFHPKWHGPRLGHVVGYRPEGDRVLVLVNVQLNGETDRDALSWVRKRDAGNTFAVRYFVESTMSLVDELGHQVAADLMVERPEDEIVGSHQIYPTILAAQTRDGLGQLFALIRPTANKQQGEVVTETDQQDQPKAPPATAEALTDRDVADENQEAAANADAVAAKLNGES